MVVHGRLEYAGKVRKATLEDLKRRGITPKERHNPFPRKRARMIYVRRFQLRIPPGQPRRRRTR